jgi:uncharacterized protein
MMKSVRYLKYSGWSILGLLSLILVWGLAKPYWIDTESEVVVIPDSPIEWEGQRIAQISDLQVGMWLDNTLTIRRIVNQLVEKRPAAILISGDFIYKPGEAPSAELTQVANLLRPLTAANIPTYAVLGNHDYDLHQPGMPQNDARASQVRQTLEAIGIKILQNEAVALPQSALPRRYREGHPSPVTPSNSSLYLVGIGAHRPQADNPAVALSRLPDRAPRVVMMHNPDTFERFPANTAPLAVAGHTCGGQIRFPFLPDWSWLTYVMEDEVHTDGWINQYGQPGNHLYVNRGIGFSVVPIRINCPPEVTSFTLQRS